MVRSVTGKGHTGLSNPNVICSCFLTMLEALYLLLIAVYTCKKKKKTPKTVFLKPKVK